MTITTFNPMIVTENADDTIKLFEELGFERRHHKFNEELENISDVRMTNADGFHVDVARADVESDMTLIRMNVDNFDEAYEFLISHGFTHPSGRTYDSKSSRDAMLVSSSGFGFVLVQHKRDRD